MNTQEENVQNKGAGMRLSIKKRFTAKRLALMAVFVALAFSVSIFSFSLFPATPVSFLEIDFGNVFILLISFLLGPIEGVIVCVLKESLHMFTGKTGGVGELANMLMTSAYILLPSIVYQYRKGLKPVVLSLCGGCILGTSGALLVNRFITFPLFEKLFPQAFLGMSAAAFFNASFGLILAFNIIKTVAISFLSVLLYKRLSNFLKKMKI